MTSVNSKVAIIGAGVFGLSTALHLKKRGYKHVTVFDYQPYHLNAYNPSEGCDSASSDVNKIYRCSYGNETEYQDLAFSGRPIWLEWNEQIRRTPARDLPRGISPETELFVPCGFMRWANGEKLSDYDLECLDYLEKAGLRDHQHHIKDRSDMSRLKEKERSDPITHWTTKVDVFQALHARNLDGFMDTSSGFTYADKACAWARHLCEKAGVRFVLGEAGRFDDFVYEDLSSSSSSSAGRKVVGVKMAGGRVHKADVVVVACGGWTPGLISEAAGVLEATAGSVCTISLPKDRPDLWDRFSPEKFPVWAYGLTGHSSPEYGGFYGFPRTPEGKIKIGYRGRKWTNYQTNAKTGKRVSIPKTKYTTDRAVNLPKKAITYVKQVIGELFPELKGVGITDTRMCWYTDSLDNSFVIDYVPGYTDTVFVASGGSGHGFKFLPVLGHHVVNALEKKRDQFTPLWHWRTAAPGQHANGLEEGEMSGRNLETLEMAEESDWIWADADRLKVGPGEVEGDVKHVHAERQAKL